MNKIERKIRNADKRVEKLMSENKFMESFTTNKFSVDGTGNIYTYLNPSMQHCFSSGRYFLQDFEEWAKGTGRIVFGKTQEEKEEYMAIARFESENKDAWMLRAYWEDIGNSFKNLEKPRTTKDKISKALLAVIRSYSNDALWYYPNLERLDDELLGAVVALSAIGCGTLGAMNYQNPENLSYMRQVAIAEVVFIYYHEKGMVPDYSIIFNKR